MAGGGLPSSSPGISGGYLSGKNLIYPLSLVISLFFLWGFSYGLLDVLNKHFQTVLGVTRLESTGLQVMYFGGGYLCFSPIAAEVLKRKGYKTTILMGLTLYSLGAIFFWPVAHFSTPTNEKAAFGGFLACTFVIACGLATLETSANSYAVVIGHPATASARLQFCQSWNGVASFTGPLIASKAFFSGENANSLTNVQYVYLAVACAGVAVGVLFFFSKLPEVEEAAVRSASITAADSEELGVALDQYGNIIEQKSLFKEYNMMLGFVAQFCYVGAQVTIATFFINYATEAASYSSEEGARLLSYGLIVFTVGRFVAAGMAYVLESNFILMVYSACCIALAAFVSSPSAHGTAGVACIIVIFFFMAPMYPSIFTLGTANLGRNTRRGAGILVMGVSGGAVFPPIQGAIADAATTRVSYLVPMVGFIVVLGYCASHWFRHGMHIMRVKGENVVASALEGGALGGAIQTVHYDEKRLSAVEIEHVRRSSLAGAAVNPITGGYHVEADHAAGLDRRNSLQGRMNATFGGYDLKGERNETVEHTTK